MGKGGSKILKNDAEAIAKKLDAETDKKGKHIHAAVRRNGELVVNFGFRHDRTAPNGHLPGQLHLSETDAVKLARCQISKDEYFDILSEKGFVSTAVNLPPDGGPHPQQVMEAPPKTRPARPPRGNSTAAPPR